MTMNTNPHDAFAKKILDRIEGEHLAPRPRWEFEARNAAFWSLGALAVLLGALASAALLFEIANAGWLYSAATHANFALFLLQVAPFLWFLVLALFTGLGYANIRHTKRGYRYSITLILLGAVLMSMTLGTALFLGGFGEEIEEAIGDHPPFYRPIMATERSFWQDPADGLIAGTVTSVAADLSSFVLQDFTGRSWIIDTEDLDQNGLAAAARGGEVRVVTVPSTGTSTLHACFVIPWQKYGESHAMPLPRPLASFATTSEINRYPARSEICKGIRPYASLRAMSGI